MYQSRIQPATVQKPAALPLVAGAEGLRRPGAAAPYDTCRADLPLMRVFDAWAMDLSGRLLVARGEAEVAAPGALCGGGIVVHAGRVVHVDEAAAPGRAGLHEALRRMAADGRVAPVPGALRVGLCAGEDRMVWVDGAGFLADPMRPEPWRPGPEARAALGVAG